MPQPPRWATSEFEATHRFPADSDFIGAQYGRFKDDGMRYIVAHSDDSALHFPMFAVRAAPHELQRKDREGRWEFLIPLPLAGLLKQRGGGRADA